MIRPAFQVSTALYHFINQKSKDDGRFVISFLIDDEGQALLIAYEKALKHKCFKASRGEDKRDRTADLLNAMVFSHSIVTVTVTSPFPRSPAISSSVMPAIFPSRVYSQVLEP